MPIAATAPSPDLDSGDLRCAYHPNTPTRLRCGRCGKPVCAKCVATTSVGQRCRDCARVRPTVTYQTDTGVILRAAAAALVAGLVLGALWGLLNSAGLGPRSRYDWGFWLSLVAGFGVAESVSWAAKRKRGVNLQLLGIGGVLLAFVVSRVLLNAQSLRPVGLQDVLAQPLLVAQALRIGLVPLLFLALACAIAYVRFR